MKNKKMLVAIFVLVLLFAVVILAAWFMNGDSAVKREDETQTDVSQTVPDETGTQPSENDTQQHATAKQFAQYIDFSQDGMGEITETGEYVNKKYRFVLHVPEVWHGNYRADVLDMTNDDAIVAYISLMYTFKGNDELLGKIVIADKETWETWEKSEMMTMPDVMMRSADKRVIYGIYPVEENPLLEGSEAYDKFEAMRIRDVQMAKELFVPGND